MKVCELKKGIAPYKKEQKIILRMLRMKKKITADEFDTKDEREEWEMTLPESILVWLDRDLIEHALSFGWHSRNFNGFIVE